MADDTKVDFYFYYHPNHLGSSNFVTRMLKREASPRHEMYEHVEYIPFGETWIEEREVLPFGASKSNRYLFTSKEFDQETRLYYYGARYYDPKTSIWLSADPILTKYLPTNNPKDNVRLPGMGGVFNSPNLNLYVYSHQNPVKLVDPDGAAVVSGGVAIGAWVGKSALEGLGDVALDKTIAHLSGEEYGSWDAVKSFGAGFGLGLIGAGVASKAKKIVTILKLTKLRSLGSVRKGVASSLYLNKAGETSKFARQVQKPGKTRIAIYEKAGGLKQANKEFDKLTRGGEVTTEVTSKGTIRKATLPGGDKVSVRGFSSGKDGGPTIQITPIDGSKQTKIRYKDD